MYTSCSHQRAFGESTTLVAVGTYSYIRCRIWQFAHLEREWSHLAKFATFGSRYAKNHILAYGWRHSNIMSVALWPQRAARHWHVYGILRNTRYTYAHWVRISSIEHIHEVGSNSSTRRWLNNLVFLQEVATKYVASTIAHKHIASKLMFAHSTCRERILTIGGIHLHTIYINLRLLSGINGCHNDIGREGFAWI